MCVGASFVIVRYSACTRAKNGFLNSRVMAEVKSKIHNTLATCAKPPSNDATSCKTYSQFRLLSMRVNEKCCREHGERCHNGLPTACNADCAGVVVSLQSACANGFLGMRGMERMKHDVAAAAKMCQQGGH